MVNVVVALVGNEHVFDAEFDPDATYLEPYEMRRKVELEVSETETLTEVLRRAAERFAVPFSVTSVAFYRGDPQETEIRSTWFVVVPNAEGRATWRNFKEVLYGDLMRAAEAGVVDGDPLRPYLIIAPQVGNGVLIDWQTYVETFKVFREICEVLGVPGALYATRDVARRLMHRSREAEQVLEQHSGRWHSAGADPHTFNEWLNDKAWHSADLGDLLGCTQSEAEAVLWSFGFAPAPSGVWRRGENEEAKMLAANVDMTIDAGSMVGLPRPRRGSSSASFMNAPSTCSRRARLLGGACRRPCGYAHTWHGRNAEGSWGAYEKRSGVGERWYDAVGFLGQAIADRRFGPAWRGCLIPTRSSVYGQHVLVEQSQTFTIVETKHFLELTDTESLDPAAGFISARRIWLPAAPGVDWLHDGAAKVVEPTGLGYAIDTRRQSAEVGAGGGFLEVILVLYILAENTEAGRRLQGDLYEWVKRRASERRKENGV